LKNTGWLNGSAWRYAAGHYQPIADLLAMTPHLYRARAATLTALTVTVDVRLTTQTPSIPKRIASRET
jgi:hypothetical protein